MNQLTVDIHILRQIYRVKNAIFTSVSQQIVTTVWNTVGSATSSIRPILTSLLTYEFTC